MEGFTASKYKQLTLDNEPKIDMSPLDDALSRGLKSIVFHQNVKGMKEELEKEINNYLSKYNDGYYKIISKVGSLEYCGDHGMTSYSSKVLLEAVPLITQPMFYNKLTN